MRHIGMALLLAALFVAVGCGGKDEGGEPEVDKASVDEPEVAKPAVEKPGVEKSDADAPVKAVAGGSIGSATMKEDGTIVLMLRAEGPGGMIGDALVTYTPDDPKYQETLDHLGGLKPGEEKPVPPWPEK